MTKRRLWCESWNRRSFLRGVVAGSFLSSAVTSRAAPGLRPRATIEGYAACSWTLRDGAPTVFELAKRIGLDGVQLDMGRGPVLPVADAATRRDYKAAARSAGVKVASLALGCLNRFPLKSDKRAPAWVVQAIDAAADFGVDVVLLAFFGAGELETRAERDRVGDILREIGPMAEKKNVRLGLENTLSAEQTLGIMKRSRSSSVVIYYDVGNARHWGHDPVAELRRLGDVVCEVHFKDGIDSHGDAYLGQGKVDFKGVAAALHAITFKGWITLEPRVEHVVQDMRKNLAFARKLLRNA